MPLWGSAFCRPPRGSLLPSDCTSPSVALSFLCPVPVVALPTDPFSAQRKRPRPERIRDRGAWSDIWLMRQPATVGGLACCGGLRRSGGSGISGHPWLRLLARPFRCDGRSLLIFGRCANGSLNTLRLPSTGTRPAGCKIDARTAPAWRDGRQPAGVRGLPPGLGLAVPSPTLDAFGDRFAANHRSGEPTVAPDARRRR